jgi:excisionase family DNA binding protein
MTTALKPLKRHVPDDISVWNTKEICQILKIHRNTLYRIVKKEGLPYIDLGGRRYVFDKADVCAWLKCRRREWFVVQEATRRQPT